MAQGVREGARSGKAERSRCPSSSPRPGRAGQGEEPPEMGGVGCKPLLLAGWGSQASLGGSSRPSPTGAIRLLVSGSDRRGSVGLQDRRHDLEEGPGRHVLHHSSWRSRHGPARHLEPMRRANRRHSPRVRWECVSKAGRPLWRPSEQRCPSSNEATAPSAPTKRPS